MKCERCHHEMIESREVERYPQGGSFTWLVYECRPCEVTRYIKDKDPPPSTPPPET